MHKRFRHLSNIIIIIIIIMTCSSINNRRADLKPIPTGNNGYTITFHNFYDDDSNSNNIAITIPCCSSSESCSTE